MTKKVEAPSRERKSGRLSLAPVAADVMEPGTLAAYIRLAGLVLEFGAKATESHIYARRIARAFGPKAWDALIKDDLITIEGDGWRLNERGRYSGRRLLYMPGSAGTPKRRPLSSRTRWKVLCRDAHRCVYCGATAADASLHVDHVVPVSKGGGDDLRNLVTACEPCNLGKSDTLLGAGE